MARSFVRLRAGDFGLNPDNLLTTQVFLSRRQYAAPEAREAFVSGVVQRLEGIAGVRSAAAINFLPLSGFWGFLGYAIEGQPSSSAADGPVADNRVVTPRYFQTMGIPFSRGRDFDARDLAGSTQVAIVNETMARRHWPTGVPPGARLDFGDADHPSLWEIVGVVGDVKSFGLDAQTHAEIYRPFAQVPFPLVAFTVRTESDPAGFAAAVRDAVWSVDKDQPVFKVLTMNQLASESITLRRVTMLLIGALAVLAIILAAIGVFGVMTYAVTRRTREIGIRIALGARRDDVVRLVLRDGVALTLAGLGLGLAGAFALTRFLAGLLYEIGPTDPLTFAAVVSILAAVSLLASYIPAHRATKVDPMVALRCE